MFSRINTPSPDLVWVDMRELKQARFRRSDRSMEATRAPPPPRGQRQCGLRNGQGWEYNLVCPVGDNVKCGQGWLHTVACSVGRGFISGIITPDNKFQKFVSMMNMLLMFVCIYEV
jgi:hypothetical protein